MKLSIITLATLVATSAVTAQVQIKTATGTATGNYSRLFKELSGQCKDQVPLVEIASKGSLDNLDKLLGNEVNVAFVQTDSLFYRARNEDLSGVKTLFAMYAEEVHVITPAVSPIKEGGVLGLGQKPIQLNGFADLAGRTVVAWGGSTITAQVVRLQSEVGFNVVEVDDFKSALAAIDGGNAAALLMVGGQPMADVVKLGAGYKFLPFADTTIAKLKSVYVPAKLNYPSFGMAGSGVPTIATEALVVTRKAPKYASSMITLRNCFKTHLGELQDTIGNSKKWSDVKLTNNGKWAYYELPAK